MKKLMILAGFMSGICGNLLSMQVGEMFANENEQITCFQCKTVEEFNEICSKNFATILEDIVVRQKPLFERMLQHPECTLDLRGKTVEEYIWSIYNQAYEDFSKGISQLLIAKNADNQLKGFVFFRSDSSYNNSLRIQRDAVLDISQLQAASFLQLLWTLIAQNICIDAKTIIVAPPRGANLLIAWMNRIGFNSCDYTGKDIDLEQFSVFEKLI